MPRPEQPIVCIIDDDQPVRDSLTTVLAVSGYQSISFDSAESFLEENACPEAAFLIVDVRLPGMSGIELLNTLASMNMERPSLVMTGHATDDTLRETRYQGEVHYLQKPSEPSKLLEIIEKALARSNNR